MKKVLVIGAKGFIGKHLIDLALRWQYIVDGIDIIEFQGETYEYHKASVFSNEFEDILSKSKYDVIINCCGSGNVGFSVINPLSDFELNVISVIHILDLIRRTQTKCRFVHFSSAAVYGNPLDLPISENHKIAPISPYGYHKWQAELACQEYAYLYKIPILILRPFSVYGPGLRKQLLWDIYLKSKKSDIIELWGTGDETRDFIYIDDLCRIIFELISINLQSFEIVNIANGESISIANISALLIEKLGYSNKIIFNNILKPGDPRFWQSDVIRLNQYGLNSLVSLDDGITKTAKWLLNNE